MFIFFQFTVLFFIKYYLCCKLIFDILLFLCLYFSSLLFYFLLNIIYVAN